MGIAALAVLSLAFDAVAAPRQRDEVDSSIWLAYIGEHAISQKWTLHLEGQFFSCCAAPTKELIFLRPGLRREFPHGMSALVTYAYFLKYPVITNASRMLPEHRISEDVQWKHPLLVEGVKRMTLTHRLRAEQRFEAQENQRDRSNAWHYAERVRYRLTANVPLPGNTIGLRPDYVSVYNEVFINFGPHSGNRTLDQNIAAGAIGWNLRSDLQFEVGYLAQYNPSATGSLGKYNHTVQINLISTSPLSRTKH